MMDGNKTRMLPILLLASVCLALFAGTAFAGAACSSTIAGSGTCSGAITYVCSHFTSSCCAVAPGCLLNGNSCLPLGGAHPCSDLDGNKALCEAAGCNWTQCGKTGDACGTPSTICCSGFSCSPSGKCEVQNTAPSGTITITPSSPSANDTLSCNATITDAEQSSNLSYEVSWYQNGTEFPAGSGSLDNNTPTLVATWGQPLVPGDTYQCMMNYHDDGNAGGSALSPLVTVAAAAPQSPTMCGAPNSGTGTCAGSNTGNPVGGGCSAMSSKGESCCKAVTNCDWTGNACVYAGAGGNNVLCSDFHNNELGCNSFNGACSWMPPPSGVCGAPSGPGECQGGSPSVACSLINNQGCCAQVSGCQWTGSACSGTGSHTVDCYELENEWACKNFSQPVSQCTWKPQAQPCGVPHSGAGNCGGGSYTFSSCSVVTDPGCCAAIGNCEWTGSQCASTGAGAHGVNCYDFIDNEQGCSKFAAPLASMCTWIPPPITCSNSSGPCDDPHFCCGGSGLTCGKISPTGAKSCCKDLGESCVVGSTCCSGLCTDRKCQPSACAFTPTVSSYLDITLDPNNKAISAFAYNLSESDYTKTLLPRALIFVVNLSDQSSPTLCYNATDANGWMEFPYSPDTPGCSDYWFIFCPLSSAADDLSARQQCLNSTGLSHAGSAGIDLITPDPAVCLGGAKPVVKNYPDHILSHNELYFCNKVPRDYAPLCWPLMLILGLLLGASFAVGKNPFAAFDMSSPRLARGRQYTARVQNMSFDMLGYIMAAAQGATSAKGAKKDSKAAKSEAKGTSDSKGKGTGFGNFMKNDFKATFGYGAAVGGTKSTAPDKTTPTSTANAGQSNALALQGGSGQNVRNIVDLVKMVVGATPKGKERRADRAERKKEFEGGKTTNEKGQTKKEMKHEQMANRNAKAVGMTLTKGDYTSRKNMSADEKKDQAASRSGSMNKLADDAKNAGNYQESAIYRLVGLSFKGEKFGQAVVHLLSVLADVLLAKYSMSSDSIYKKADAGKGEAASGIFSKNAWKGGVKPVANTVMDLIKLLIATYSITCEISNYSKSMQAASGKSDAKGFMDDSSEHDLFSIRKYKVNTNAFLSWLDPGMQAAGTGPGIMYPLSYIVAPVADGLKLTFNMAAQSIDNAVARRKYGKGADAPVEMAVSPDGNFGFVQGRDGNHYFQKNAQGKWEGYNPKATAAGAEDYRLMSRGVPVKEGSIASMSPSFSLDNASLDNAIKNGTVAYARQARDSNGRLSYVPMDDKQQASFVRRLQERNNLKIEALEYLVKDFGLFTGARRQTAIAAQMNVLKLQNDLLADRAASAASLKLSQDLVERTRFIMNEVNAGDMMEKVSDLMANPNADGELKKKNDSLDRAIANSAQGTRAYNTAKAEKLELEALGAMREMYVALNVDPENFRKAKKLTQRLFMVELDATASFGAVYLRNGDRQTSGVAQKAIADIFEKVISDVNGFSSKEGLMSKGSMADGKVFGQLEARLDSLESKVAEAKKTVGIIISKEGNPGAQAEITSEFIALWGSLGRKQSAEEKWHEKAAASKADPSSVAKAREASAAAMELETAMSGAAAAKIAFNKSVAQMAGDSALIKQGEDLSDRIAKNPLGYKPAQPEGVLERPFPEKAQGARPSAARVMEQADNYAFDVGKVQEFKQFHYEKKGADGEGIEFVRALPFGNDSEASKLLSALGVKPAAKALASLRKDGYCEMGIYRIYTADVVEKGEEGGKFSAKETKMFVFEANLDMAKLARLKPTAPKDADFEGDGNLARLKPTTPKYADFERDDAPAGKKAEGSPLARLKPIAPKDADFEGDDAPAGKGRKKADYQDAPIPPIARKGRKSAEKGKDNEA